MAKSVRVGALILTFLVVLCSKCCLANKYLANESYTYRLHSPNGSTCMTVSMNAYVVIYYMSVNSSNRTDATLKNVEFSLPPKNDTEVMMSNCTDDSRILSLSWFNGDFSISLNFSVKPSRWYLSQVNVQFLLDEDSFQDPDVTGLQSYVTTDGKELFNRTFGTNQYFRCKACKRLWLRGANNDSMGNDTGPCYKKLIKGYNYTYCSHVYLQNSVIFPGDLDNNSHVSKKLCLEDFIDLQEIIIPAAVGGILGLLLILIFSAYLVAFIRRKRREGQYETINDAY